MAKEKQRNTFAEDEMLDQEFNKEQLKKLLIYLAKYSSKVLMALIVILVSSLANLVTPLIMKFVIDDIIPGHDIKGLIIISTIFIAIIIISSICMKFRIRFMSEVGQSVIKDIRTDIFTHIQTLPFTFYDNRPHGKILVRIVNYVNSLSDLISNGLINLIVDLFSFIVALIIMITLDFRLTIVILLFIPFAFAGITYIKNRQRKSMQEVSSKQANMNAYIHESISGMKVTQSFTREKVNLKIFTDIMDEYQDKWIESRHYMALIFPLVKNISILSQGIMMIVALVIFKGNISPGVVVAALGYSGNFWMPLLNISEFYNQLVSSSAYLERIFETIDIKPEIKDKENAYTLPAISGEIIFNNVTFGYEKDHIILENFNLHVKSGERIALVGPTGAGKTTVVNLISRFYDIQSGAITIDGHNIQDVTINSLRSQMGIMMQDTFIFSGTIIDNIRYGKLDATDEEVIEAAKTVKAHDFIIQMENGYNTEVNERGTRLSTGQRQLISFARALLMNPKILILDEATSSIDTQTEKIIQESLEKLLVNRTSFVIAHRLSTIKNADRIIVINNKGIEEIGNHDELMSNQGHYFNLYSAQIKFLKENVK